MVLLILLIRSIGSMLDRMTGRQVAVYGWIWWTFVCGTAIHELPGLFLFVWPLSSFPVLIRLMSPEAPAAPGEYVPSRREWWAWNEFLVLLAAAVGMLMWKAPLWLYVPLVFTSLIVMIIHLLFDIAKDAGENTPVSSS